VVEASPFGVQTVGELQARLEVERAGVPFVLFRDQRGDQQIVVLPRDADEIALGRGPEEGLRFDWDPEISRVHALLERVGGVWTVIDDGLSRNGTFVNDARLLGRRRLHDGDVVRLGSVTLQFRDPAARAGEETIRAPDEASPASRLSPAQQRVLVALCRPLREEPYGPPATNKAIAQELTLSVDAVKTHLRRIAEVLEIGDLPQNEKRAKLAWTALTTGLVTPRDLFG
jgi:pSer/pThr/pTyr-binding forkhead associated (FHA) protein